MPDINNYRELRDFLNTLSDLQLDQPVQIAPPHVTPDPVPLQPAIHIDTVDNLNLSPSRSCHDNKYHGSDLVILADRNQFAVDGATSYLITDHRKKNPDESIKQFFEATMEPHYAKGKTDPRDQFKDGIVTYDWNDTRIYEAESDTDKD